MPRGGRLISSSEWDLIPKVVVLPENEDPDSFVQKQNGEAVWQRINAALSPVDFQLYLSKRAGAPVRHAVRELMNSASFIASHVDREVMLKEVAEKSGCEFGCSAARIAQANRPIGCSAV